MVDDEDLDLLWGARAIGEALDVSARKAFYLLQKKAIPARKVAGCWVASRGRLREFFTKVENEGAVK